MSTDTWLIKNIAGSCETPLSLLKYQRCIAVRALSAIGWQKI